MSRTAAVREATGAEQILRPSWIQDRKKDLLKMPRKMLINALHPEESRVAIVDENGRLVDLDIEIAGSEQMRGNIYKGTVLRVEPGLQAAFVDIGLKKPAFIQMGELHPDSWQWRDDIPEDQRKRRPRIQEVLRRGQELIVQVEKDERDMKGAAVTTYLSLPGRYMVIMPGSDSTGISRKVEGEGERKKLKELAAQMTFREGVGYIIRTEAMGRSVEELQYDMDQLLAKYDEIVETGSKTKGPAIIYKEFAVVIRTIRDYFSADIDEVLVDSKEVYKEAKEFFKEIMPKFEKRVKMHQEKRPIFSRFQIEEQIDQIYEKKVPLKSGGSLVIEPTEALVSIDVNSGKSTGERNVEDTAFRTNLEAVEEAARQLRLRDLGGLIVLDLIDMRELKHIKEVEKSLKDALKSDKARVTVGRISQFGMLEMSRQRIKQTLEQGSILDCPHCSGRGKVKGVENMAISFLRKVHAAAAKGNAAEVRGGLPLEVAYYLLNRKKRELAQIENDYDIEVTIKGKPSFLMNQLELEVVKREKPPQEAPAEVKEEKKKPAEPVAAAAAPAPEEKAAEGEAPAKKKRSRSKKKHGEPETAEPVGETLLAEPVSEPVEEQPAETAPESEAPEEHHEPGKKKRKRRKKKKVGAEAVETAEEAVTAEPPAEPESDAGEEPLEPGRKKRKRRRKKKGKGAEEHAAEGETAPTVHELPPEAEHQADEESEHAAEEHTAEHHKKRKRRRRKRGGAKGAEAETAVPVAHVEAPAPAPEPLPEPPAEEKKPKARKPRKKAPAVEAAEAPAAAAVPEPAPEEKKPKRASRKKAAEPQPEPLPAPVEAATPEEKPKKAKSPARKKKPAATGEQE
jgi:ribonuclease E